MSTKVRMLNTTTGKSVDLDGMTLYKCLLAFRYWPVLLFTTGRPLMGLTGVALIVIAIVFGAMIDGEKIIAAFAGLSYVFLGVYFSVNQNKLLVRFYLKHGWVRAP